MSVLGGIRDGRTGVVDATEARVLNWARAIRRDHPRFA
jgi:hypothetical protein